jgi:hypothetical protein
LLDVYSLTDTYFSISYFNLNINLSKMFLKIQNFISWFILHLLSLHNSSLIFIIKTYFVVKTYILSQKFSLHIFKTLISFDISFIKDELFLSLKNYSNLNIANKRINIVISHLSFFICSSNSWNKNIWSIV